jgi:hypothetical protein
MTPLFSMPIWFQDSIGNRDTIWVGADTTATSLNLNPKFGEHEITAPFDSVFEVRVCHGDDNNWRMSKKIIESTDWLGCPIWRFSRIMIHALHFPVKISWDTTLLKTISPCNVNTVLTPNQDVFLLPNWYDAQIIYCMMTKSQIFEDFAYESHPSSWLVHPFEVKGQGIKNIKGLYLLNFWDLPYCYTTLGVSEDGSTNDLLVFPNPFIDEIHLAYDSNDIPKDLILFDLSSNVIKTWNVSSQLDKIQIGVPPGVYLLEMRFKSGQRIIKKLVKA